MSAPPDPPTFAAPWEAQTFAIVVALQEAGLFTWGEWADALGAASRHSGGPTDYALWLQTIEALVAERGIAGAAILADRREAFARAAAATPHGQPILLDERSGAVTPAGRQRAG